MFRFFQALVRHGASYLISHSPALRLKYYGDVLFYRTCLNNTSAFLKAQREQAMKLLEMVLDSYELD